MRYFEIIEARRNPSLNTKTPINDIIREYHDNAPALEGTDIKNSFATFTALPKIGINPKSIYRTPLGIYAYNTGYVLEKMGSEKPATRLPFAGQQPYIHLFQSTGNVIVLQSVNDASQIYKKLEKVYSRRTGNDNFDTIVEYAKSHSRDKTDGGIIWFITMAMSDIITDGLDMDQVITKRARVDKFTDDSNEIKPESRTWNAIFRAIGISGIVDLGGSMIHPSEPNQAVFLSTSSIINVQMHNNKYSPETTQISDEQKPLNVTLKRFSRMNNTQRVKLLHEIYDGDIGNIFELMDYALKSGKYDMYITPVLKGQNNEFHKTFIQMASANDEYLEFFEEFVFEFELGYGYDRLPGKESLALFIIERYNNFSPDMQGMLKNVLGVILDEYRSVNQYVSALSLAVKYLDEQMIEFVIESMEMTDTELEQVKQQVPALNSN